MVLLQGYVKTFHDSSQGSDRTSGGEDVASDSDSDDDDGDFENHDLQDITDIANGKYQHFTSSGTKKLQIDLQILEDGGRRHTDKIRRVSGRFDPRFLQPFWMISVEVKDGGGLCFANSAPSYRPRHDSGVNRDVCSLFLESCHVHSQHKELFLNFMTSNGPRCSLTGMQDDLSAFGNSSPTNKEISQQIQRHLRTSVQGKTFLSSGFTRYIHRLFPRQASKLLENQPLKILQKLSVAVQEEPWIFGYRTILRNRFGLLGCEAKIKSLKDCKLYEQMNEERRDALVIYHTALRSFSADGHTFIPLADLKRKDKCKAIQHWDQPLEFLRHEKVLESEETQHSGIILYLPQMRQYENNIAENIAGIMEETPWIAAMDLNEQAFGDDADQIKAARLIANCPVVVMSGKGGCGKTHVISEVLKGIKDLPNSEEELELENPRESPAELENSGQESDPDEPCEMEGPVLLTAPTGKAASILGKRTSMNAYTLHHVIYSFFHHLQEKRMKKDAGLQCSPWKFTSVQMLVCDECSLVAVKTFATLTDILRKHSRLKQLVLLGDINQLPSIEPGNFLSDVYRALEPHGMSVTLRTNHRSESELIIQNANCISQQELPKFDSQRGFEAIAYDCNSGPEGLGISEAVKTILKEKGLSQRESQFIAFRNSDCLKINELCSLHYNEHCLKDPNKRDDFRVGDKICIGRNRTCFDYFGGKEERLCNGDIFFIEEDVTEENNKSKIRYLKLDDGERQLKVEFRELKRAKMKHAWAKTIHTYQGSETDAVVYVVGKPWYQNWQHVYTAVTRGKSRVFIICDHSELRKAVESKPIMRNTRLKEFLQEKGALPGRRLRELCDDLGIDVPLPTTAQSNKWRTAGEPFDSPVKHSRVITARYSTVCDVCDEFIQPGVDEIIFSETTQAWIHVSCHDHYDISMEEEELLLQATQAACETEVTSTSTTREQLPDSSGVTSLPVDLSDEPDIFMEEDDSVLVEALQAYESSTSVDELGLSKVTLAEHCEDAADEMTFSISRKNLRRGRRSEYTPEACHSSQSCPPQSPTRFFPKSSVASPPRTPERVLPPKTSTPVKASSKEQGQLGGGRNRSMSPGNPYHCVQVSSPSRTSSPLSASRVPGSQFASYSRQSPTTPRVSPSKRQGEPESQSPSPGKRVKVRANFDGTCGACGMRIYAGDQITALCGTSRKWAHFSCGD